VSRTARHVELPWNDLAQPAANPWAEV